MKKFVSFYGLLLALAVVFSSCYKKPIGTFFLKGRLLSSTDSTAVAGHSVTVMYKLYKGGLSGEKRFVEVGAARSNTSGFFEVSCDYYPSSAQNYYFEEDDFPGHANHNLYPQGKGDTVDMGDVYLY